MLAARTKSGSAVRQGLPDEVSGGMSIAKNAALDQVGRGPHMPRYESVIPAVNIVAPIKAGPRWVRLV